MTAVLAHGGGAHGPPPIGWWAAAYLLVAVVAITTGWVRGRPEVGGEPAARPRTTVPGATGGAHLTRAVGLVVLVVALVSGWFGPDTSAVNLVGPLVHSVVGLGIPLLGLLVAPAWRALDPMATLTRWLPDHTRRRGPDLVAWSAPVGAATLVWLHLGRDDPYDPTLLVIAITAWVVAGVATAVRFGRAWWERHDPVANLFASLARPALVSKDARSPAAGAATAEVGTLPALEIVLGGVLFSGVVRTTWWFDQTYDARGWGQTAWHSAGLLGCITLTVVVVEGAVRVVRRGPVTAALASVGAVALVTDGARVLIFDTQFTLRALSDPLQRGWDLLGTADWVPNPDLWVGASLVWTTLAVAAAALAIGVVAADRRARADGVPLSASRAGAGGLLATIAVGIAWVLIAT